MAYPPQIFTTLSFLGFVLAAVPLPWHLEAWNTGTCLYMIWVSLGCLNFFINSIIWHGHANLKNIAPLWCDISSRIIVANYIAIPASSFCIARRLYLISSVKTVTTSKVEKRRGVIVDLSIGLGIPLVVWQIIYYINQHHRFKIYQDVGCWVVIHPTWVAHATMTLPPIIMGLISAYYSIRSAISFHKSRTQFKEMISSHSNLTSSRYLRLMLMAGTEIIATVPLSIVGLCLNVSGRTLVPWISWEDTHSNFSRVDLIPAEIWRSNATSFQLEFARYLTVACAFIFFGFFGFADEARTRYRLAVRSISSSMGMSTTPLFGTTTSGIQSSHDGLKSNSTRKVVTLNRRGSMDSDISVSQAKVSSFLTEPIDDEKISQFGPIPPYGATTLTDVDGHTRTPRSTMPDFTRKSWNSNIEISSLRRDSLVLSPASYEETLYTEKAHTPGVF